MKKRIAAVLIMALVVFCFAGCGGKEEPQDTGEGSNGGDQKETVIMATNAEFPPFEYLGEDNLPAGVDIDISNAVAEALGKELKIENMEFTSVLTSLPTNKADFAAAGLTIDPTRLDSVDFSIPYYTATQYIIVKEDNAAITDAESLKSANVGAIDGFTGQQICRDTLKLPNLVGYKKGADAVTELMLGRIDAVVIDSHTALAMVGVNEGLKIVKDNEVFGKEEYALAVKKGNQELLDQINEVLTKLIDEGQIDAWVSEHAEATGALEEEAAQ